MQAAKNIFMNPSLWGSLAGALLSSSVAILIMIRNAERERKTKHKDKLEDFLIEAVFFRESVNYLVKHMKAYAFEQHLEEGISRIDLSARETRQLNDVKAAKKLHEEDILRYFSKIKSTNKNRFTYDYFQHYLKIIDLCEHDLEFFWDRSMKNDVSGVAEIMDSAIKDLKIELEKLDDIISKKEIEFENIK
ncbi:hypothetical protein [Bacillus sonorensis]|uniref:hypothetical protein n=2 Tax=Bacillus sonorensis TaxID=119858 RepID=UPI0022808E98|nr:hypothetical protein [Bacillus sonorensis]MCY8606607.1 hypothetical protein [Bacillus sonorensis]